MPANSDFSTFNIPLTFDNLIDLSDSGTNDLAATLADVTELRVLHNPLAQASPNGPAPAPAGAAAIGDLLNPIAGTLLIDNITAVPEPGTLVLLALSCGYIAAKRRRR